MEQFKKLHSKSGFTEQIEDVKAFLTEGIKQFNERNPKFAGKPIEELTELLFNGVSDSNALMTQLKEYNSAIVKMYTPTYGKYPNLNADNLNAIKVSATNLKAQIENVKKLYKDNHLLSKSKEAMLNKLHATVVGDLEVLNRIELRGPLTLPQAVYKFSGKAYEIDSNPANNKGVSFFEYSKIYAGTSKSEKAVVKEYMNTPADQLMAKYKAEIDKDPRKYEYSTVNSIIPDDVLFTGDVEKIDNYLNSEAANNLTYPERKVLEAHKNATLKSEEIKNKHAHQYRDDKHFPHVDNGHDVARIKIDLDSHQTSSQGCWSCAGTMLLKSKGISGVTQEMIRAFRPKLEENAILDGEFKKQYNTDTTGNVMDKGDSILAFAPDCMLKEVQVVPYGEEAEKAGYTLEQYINNTTEFLKKQIKHAILDDHSAVAFLTPGHYITVTGIDGDTLEYKESSKGANQPVEHTFKMSLKAFVKKQFFKQKSYERLPITIKWLADINMSNDGKTIYGVPSEYAGINEDGSIILPPEDIQAGANANLSITNRDGIAIQRSGGKEQSFGGVEFTDGGIYKVERVYLPKKVDYAYLKERADHRSVDETEILIKRDKEFLGIDRNNPNKAAEIDNGEIKLNEIKVNAALNVDYSKLSNISSALSTMKSNLNAVTPKWFFKKSDESITMEEKLDSFTDTIRELEHIAKTGADQEAGEKKAKEADKSLAELIASVEAYLDFKNTQMLDDPTRRNASGKSKVEQPRIKNAIEMLEKLYSIRTTLKMKKLTNDERLANYKAEEQFRENVINEYRNALLSDKELNVTPKMVQEATYKNQTKNLNADQLKKLDQYEAMFGMTPDNKVFVGYNMAEYVPKGSNKPISEFNKLKQITNTFKAIGSDDPMDRLSNKDFTAIALAASLSRDVYNKMSHKVAYNEYQYHFVNALSASNDGGAISDLDVCELSRQEAAKALTEYKNGNKKPLAHLIKAGLRSLGDGFYYHELHWDASLYSSEMGKRLYSMLKRDPELYSLAKKDGFENRDIQAIHINEVIGDSGSKASYTYNACGKNYQLNEKNDRFPLYDPKDQVEIRTDMLMGRIFKDTESWRKGQMEDEYEYQVAMMQSDIEIYKYANKLSGEISKELKTAFEDDPTVTGWLSAYRGQVNVALTSAEFQRISLAAQKLAFEADAGKANGLDKEDPRYIEIISKRNNKFTQMAQKVMAVKNDYMKTTSTENDKLLDKLNEHIKPINKELSDLVKKSQNTKLNEVEVKKVDVLKKKVAALNKAINSLENFGYSISVKAGNLEEKVEQKYKLQDPEMLKLGTISGKHALRKKVRDYVVKYGIDQLDSKKFIMDVYEKWSHRNVIVWIKGDKPFHGDISDISLPKNDSFVVRNVKADEDRRVEHREKKFDIDRTNKGGVAEAKHGPKM